MWLAATGGANLRRVQQHVGEIATIRCSGERDVIARYLGYRRNCLRRLSCGSTLHPRPTSEIAGMPLMSESSKVNCSFEQPRNAGTLPIRLDRSAPLAERIAEAKASRHLIGAIYARSSGAGLSCDHQVAECLTYAAHHGIFVPAEFIFVDRANGRAGREALRRAEATIDEAIATVLLIADLTSVFRSTIRILDYLLELVKKGVRTIVVRQAIDTEHAESARMLLVVEAMRADTVKDHQRRLGMRKARVQHGRDDPSD